MVTKIGQLYPNSRVKISGFVRLRYGKETEIFKSGGGNKTSKELDVNFLGKIPLDQRIVQTGDKGRLFTRAYPDSDASKSFSEIVKNFKNL